MSRRRQLTAVFGAAGILLITVGYLASARNPDSPARATRVASSTPAAPAPSTPPTAPSPAPTAPVGGPRKAGRIVVFGDSLMHEAHSFLAWDLADLGPIETHTYPMTAPCDFRDSFDRALVDPPSMAVFEFSGNAMTSCMSNDDGSFPDADGITARYEADAAAIAERFAAAGTTVVWVDAPRGRPDASGTGQFSGPEPFTAAIYRANAQRFDALGLDVRFVAAGRAVLTDRGAWTATLPCDPADTAAGACQNGTAAVRAPDGAHFCPSAITDADGTCSVWSSGAWRYADAIARALRAIASPPLAT